LTEEHWLDYVLSRKVRGLYAIADVGTLDARRLNPLAFAEAVLSASPAVFQLRAKHWPARETLGLLRELAPMCRRAGVPLVANDRPDLAILAGCDLVHVGQTDMPVDQIRRIAPGLGIGVSTHTMEQLETALASRPAYIAFGPVFETATKTPPDAVVGIAALHAARVRSQAAGIPLVAIGGITRDRARELVDVVEVVAAISALLPPVGREAVSPAGQLVEVAARARDFQQIFASVPAAIGHQPTTGL
jgi:thiamine-phosphate pyrophosphorylase